jgi:hypothetical protein
VITGSNRTCQLRKPIRPFLRAAPKAHGLTLLRGARLSRFANDMMPHYALWLSLRDAGMAINVGPGPWPNEPATQHSAIS